VRAKTANGHFCHFSDEQRGKKALDEVAQDAVEVEEEPGEGNPACRQLLCSDLRVSEQLDRDDDENENYEPDDKGKVGGKPLRLCVRVLECLVVTIEPSHEGVLIVHHKEASTEGKDSNKLKCCFGEDLLWGGRHGWTVDTVQWTDGSRAGTFVVPTNRESVS